MRIARIRAQYAQQGRLKARRFAEAEKRPTQTKGGLVHGNEGPPVLGCEVLGRTMYTTARFLKNLMKQDEFFLQKLEDGFGAKTHNAGHPHLPFAVHFLGVGELHFYSFFTFFCLKNL